MTLKRTNQYLCTIFHSIIYRMKVKPKNHYDVVVVRSDAIGDFVLWMSAIPLYRRKFLGKKMLLICPKPDKELAELSEVFDNIIVFDREQIEKNILYHIKIMFSFKKISADIVINPTWQHQLSADYICAMIHSDLKIGTKIKRDGVRSKWCDKYFTKLIEMPDLQMASEFEAIECFTRKVIDSDYRYTLADVSKINNKFTPSFQGRYCCISLSSSTEMKNWPIERVSEIIKTIPPQFDIVLLGYGVEDIQKASYIMKEDSNYHVIHNLVNTTSVSDMFRVISKADFVMANDSLAVHMAAASRVRSICYMHGAHFNRFLPYPVSIPEKTFHPRCVFKLMDCYGCNYKCKYDKNKKKPLFCLREVTPEMVNSELDKLIKEIN